MNDILLASDAGEDDDQVHPLPEINILSTEGALRSSDTRQSLTNYNANAHLQGTFDPMAANNSGYQYGGRTGSQ